MNIVLTSQTVDRCIEQHCLADPEGHALSLFHGGQWHATSRGEFWEGVERYARFFAIPFQPGDLVLFIKRLDLDLLMAYIGAIRAGVLPAMISPTSSKVSPEEHHRKLMHLFALTGAHGVFSDPDLSLPATEVKQVTPRSPAPDAPNLLAHESVRALVQFSSGSTGLQKGVLLSHRSLIAHMQDYSRALHLTPDDRLVSWLPLYHDMGLIACFMMPLMTGIPVLMMDPFDWIMRPDLLLETIETQRPTLCFLPNFAYHVLANKGKPRDLSSIRLFVNCSEPAYKATHDAFRTKFPTVDPGALGVCYALAENTFAVSQTEPGRPVAAKTLEGKEVLSCGTVLPGTEVRILDPNPGGIGEVAIRGTSLFDRYLGPDVVLEDGFYRTGDLGFLTEDRELFITGRKKDLIIVNGKNLYPQDVEACCNTLPGVYPGRSVAFGVMNEATGSEDLFVIVERDGSVEDTPLKLSVQRAVEAEVGIVPRRVEVVDHMRLVKTSSGKISRSRNKELYLQGEFN